MWQPKLYNYALESALVCKEAVDEALAKGRSLAVIGGGHHAEYDRPLGFCTVNTMAISALYASRKLHKKTAIIDLDIHYSNGCFDILNGKEGIFCYSIWNKKVDKWKFTKSGNNLWHRKVETKDDYFRALSELFKHFEERDIDLVLYHLGMDPLEIDRMGGIVGFGSTDLYKREKMVSKFLDHLRIPYTIFLGGAYINYSKGEKAANRQKKSVTGYQYRALGYHLKASGQGDLAKD